MTSWLLYFLLLTPDASSNFPLYTRYVTLNDVTCNQDRPAGGQLGLSPPADPSVYYFPDPDPARTGKACRLDVIPDMIRLQKGTYLAVAVTLTRGSVRLIGLGGAELFVRD